MVVDNANVGAADLETALAIGKTANQQPERRNFMQNTRLGNTGLIVSRLSFGAMTFGSDPSISAIFKVDRENARAMIERSIEAGVNFFDTADMYAGGQSEVR